MGEANITIHMDESADRSKEQVRVTLTPAGGSWVRFYGAGEAGPFLDLGTGPVSVTLVPASTITASDVAAARALLIAVADYAAEVERLHLAREATASAADVAAA